MDSAFPIRGLKISHPYQTLSGCVCTFRLCPEAEEGALRPKASTRAWYQLVTIVLIDFGFTKCVSDPCIFLLNVEKTWLWSEVYIYDILKAGNNRAVIYEVKGYIEYHFKIKDMCPVKTMLGNSIYHNVF